MGFNRRFFVRCNTSYCIKKYIVRFIRRFMLVVCIFVIAFNSVCVNVYANNYNNLEDTQIDELVDSNKDFSIVYNEKTYTYRKHSSGGWVCFELLHTTNTWKDNDALKAFLKADTAIENFENWVDSQKWGAIVQIAIGYITQSPTATLWGIADLMSYEEVESTFNTHTTVDSEGNINMDNEAINNLKTYFEEQYRKDNGVLTVKSGGKIIDGCSTLKEYFEYEEDYTDFVSKCSLYDYLLTGIYNGSACVIGFNKEDFLHLYFSTDTSKIFGGYIIYNADSELNGSHVKVDTIISDVANLDYIFTEVATLAWRWVGDWQTEFNSTITGDRIFDYLFPAFEVADGDYPYSSAFTLKGNYNYQLGLVLYSANGEPLQIYENYEKLYNYVHGEGTYIASKFYDDVTNLQITQKELAEDIAIKLEDIYYAISNGASGLTNAEDIQKLIDSSIATLDDIKDETEETNTNLKELIDIVKEQNKILLEMLDVTESIDRSVNNIEAMSTIEMINSLFGQFNKCAEKMQTTFPFSVPFDLLIIFGYFACEPETPNWTIDFNPLIEEQLNGQYNEELVINVSLERLQPIADLSRSMLCVLFVLRLTLMTRKMFFNGGKIDNG